MANLAIDNPVESFNLQNNVFSTNLAGHHVNELLLELSKSLLVAYYRRFIQRKKLLRTHLASDDIQSLLLLKS